jgi:hypothetical protein
VQLQLVEQAQQVQLPIMAQVAAVRELQVMGLMQ